MSVLFYTVADGPYEHFIAPHIASGLISNPGSMAEILVENVAEFEAARTAQVAALNAAFPDRWKLTQLDAAHHGLPIRGLINAERFLRVPTLSSQVDSVYIGDVDILTTDGAIESVLTRHAQQLGLCYSNVIRPGTQRLSGLHFVMSKAYYGVVDEPFLANVCRVGMAKRVGWPSDEEVLYDLCASAFQLPQSPNPKVANFRPVFGIHTSPNRKPIDITKPDWGIADKPKSGAPVLKADRMSQWSALKADTRWQAVAATFDDKYKAVLAELEAAIASVTPKP